MCAGYRGNTEKEVDESSQFAWRRQSQESLYRLGYIHIDVSCLF